MIQIKMNKERRYILFIGVILLLLGVTYRFYPSIQGLLSNREDIELKKQKVSKYRVKASSHDPLKKRMDSSRSVLERVEAGLIDGETAALAAVNIQNVLNEIAYRGGTTIQSMQVLKPKKLSNEGYLDVRVQLKFQSTIRQLKQMLYRIETTAKLLTISNLRIHANSEKSSHQLRGEMIVSGVMKTP